MKVLYCKNSDISFLAIFFLFSNVFSAVFHGAGIQMTNNGTGVYYKPGVSLDNSSYFIADIGCHFNASAPKHTMKYYTSIQNNRKIFLQLLAGYKKKILKENIVGILDPIFIFQGGTSLNINKLSNIILEEQVFIYAMGVGFQFYNGIIINEILLKINQLFLEQRNISFQLSIYWE
jgi:hypothetical protein